MARACAEYSLGGTLIQVASGATGCGLS
jgi:hypothetical protein